ncbi:MAG: hypothetical protein AABX65_04410 [Nanoarchaeota archaeon]
MRNLKPSHREKKRYLLIEGKDATKEKIEKTILDYIGILGFAKASPQLIKKTSKGLILAINRKELDKVRASFLLSGNKIQIKRVSGTLKSLK